MASPKTQEKPVMTNLKGQTLLTLRTLKEKNPASLAAYEKLGGYLQLKRLIVDKVKAMDIINQVKLSGLRFFCDSDGRRRTNQRAVITLIMNGCSICCRKKIWHWFIFFNREKIAFTCPQSFKIR